MKRTAALSLLILGLTACSLFEEDLAPNPGSQNFAPTVTLNASTLSGTAPLSVTFTATASDPDGDTLSYKWSLAGAADAPTVNQTFVEAGSYPVSVTVSDGKLEASASVNVTVTDGDTEPEPDPDPEPDVALRITASAGGPVPWGVTYEVKTNGEVPEGSTLSVTCAGQSAADLGTFKKLEVKNVFSCIHLATGEEVISVLKDKSGKVLTQKEQTADVQASTGIPFGGAWEYRGDRGDSFSESAMFSITQAVDTATGQGEGEYNFEGDISPAVFTLSAKGNRVMVDQTTDSSAEGGPTLDRTLSFIGTYTDRAPKRKQVFLAPNTQDFDSDEGYLYTAQ